MLHTDNVKRWFVKKKFEDIVKYAHIQNSLKVGPSVWAVVHCICFRQTSVKNILKNNKIYIFFPPIPWLFLHSSLYNYFLNKIRTHHRNILYIFFSNSHNTRLSLTQTTLFRRPTERQDTKINQNFIEFVTGTSPDTITFSYTNLIKCNYFNKRYLRRFWFDVGCRKYGTFGE